MIQIMINLSRFYNKSSFKMRDYFLDGDKDDGDREREEEENDDEYIKVESPVALPDA